MKSEKELNALIAAAAERLGIRASEEWDKIAAKFFNNARTFKDLTSLTPESIEAIYLAGYTHYNSGRFADAEKIFQLLAILNHFEKKFWKALAAARQMQSKYETALHAYGYLGILDLRDPMPPFQSAQCFLRLGKKQEAESALRAAIFNSKDRPEMLKIHNQAEALLATLTKRKAAAPTATAPSLS